ncbi:MAG TPA: hypothetical protein VGH14_14710 [Solirubrobacterales bacterium]
MLPASFIPAQDLTSGAGGIAAAIAIGAFIGQVLGTLRPASDLRRRRFIAAGGLIGLALMIGLILLSITRW